MPTLPAELLPLIVAFQSLFSKSVWGPAQPLLVGAIRYYAQQGRRHQKLTQRAWQMIALVARWLPQRALVFVTDSSFAVLDLLDRVSHFQMSQSG